MENGSLSTSKHPPAVFYIHATHVYRIHSSGLALVHIEVNVIAKIVLPNYCPCPRTIFGSQILGHGIKTCCYPANTLII